ncbi:MAG: hypothetical protein HW412_2071 [Bacteroidetes bacterium]|nr:hypothetical protein [Bacteroidota bacterium]
MNNLTQEITSFRLYDDRNTIDVRMPRTLRPFPRRLERIQSNFTMIQEDGPHIVSVHDAALRIDDISFVWIDKALCIHG